jgi:hypothetical protein
MGLKLFDVKLTDGRYFPNVTIYDEMYPFEKIENILNYCGNAIYLYHCYDDNNICESPLAVIKPDKIEYVCEAYKYENKI